MAQLFQPPGVPQGDALQQTAQLYRHLYAFTEQLNAALQALDTRMASTATEAARAASGGAWGGVGGASQEQADEYNNLRSLIIKTAHTVELEMNAIVEDFSRTYLAQSEFGTFLENLDTRIETGAEGILLGLDYSARLDDLDESAAGFSSYQARTEQYIKIGIVKYNDDGTTEAGVVVGNNLSTVEVDGKEIVRSDNMYSCFTAQRLSFWKDEQEVAYFSNRALHVHEIVVNESITIGGWKITAGQSGLVIKWIGG